jgi:hypothetical protein
MPPEPSQSLPLPRKTGLKGGIPFSPLDLISQFVPVPLPFITNHFFPGSPETIDSFFHHLLHNGYKSFLKEHSDILTLAFSQDFMSIFLLLQHGFFIKISWKDRTQVHKNKNAQSERTSPIVKYVLRYNEIVVKGQKLNWKQNLLIYCISFFRICENS